jgi:hypothetical protein
MKTAHAGMRITESQWRVFMKHLGAAFDSAKVGQREKGECLGIFEALKPEIGVK